MSFNTVCNSTGHMYANLHRWVCRWQITPEEARQALEALNKQGIGCYKERILDFSFLKLNDTFVF